MNEEMISERHLLKKAIHKGEFWKPCPGTIDEYLCCGYQIITPLTGCGMYCSYCILQAYFDHQHQTWYENLDDLEREVHEKMARHTSGVVRFGTGEFGDSLFQENRLGLSRRVASVLDRYENVLVEFKTKSTNVRTLDQIENPRKVVIGFSLNTDEMVERLEKGTAPIKKRLEAACLCEKMGFNVAFHFDPMVWYRDWETDYRRVVSMIYDHIRDPEKIIWCSIGGFRTMPALKARLRNRREHLPLFAGEMITAADGKLRYPRPLRTAFYRAMDEEFRKYHPDVTLYMCMESREVWESSGMVNRIPRGLVCYLDDRARTVLGLPEKTSEKGAI
ncbi:MAG: radical SAM protein [Chitinispirillaceae bacterium]